MQKKSIIIYLDGPNTSNRSIKIMYCNTSLSCLPCCEFINACEYCWLHCWNFKPLTDQCLGFATLKNSDNVSLVSKTNFLGCCSQFLKHAKQEFKMKQKSWMGWRKIRIVLLEISGLTVQVYGAYWQLQCSMHHV